MFQIKYEISLQNGDVISLYGEDYFGDKKVFWENHQDQLQELWAKVQEVGAPITILEYPAKNKTQIDSIESFKNWLKKKQPFIR